MTLMKDPDEVWRESLDNAPVRTEDHPPVILRAEVWPYPDLRRIWIRVQISPFDAYPNLELTITDTEGQTVSSMYLVEVRDTYQSLTLHLRHEPQPGLEYHFRVEMVRGDEVLDTREIDFSLVFTDPKGEGSQGGAG